MSHQLQFLSYSDAVVVLEKGALVTAGSFEEVSKLGTGSAFGRMFAAHHRAHGSLKIGEEAEGKGEDGSVSSDESSASSKEEGEGPRDGVGEIERKLEDVEGGEEGSEEGKPAGAKDEGGAAAVKPTPAVGAKSGSLIIKEDREEGAVKFGVYWAYVKTWGIPLGFLIGTTLLIQHGSKVRWLLNYSFPQRHYAATASFRLQLTGGCRVGLRM